MAKRIDEWQIKMTENVNSVLSKLSGASDRTVAKFTKGQRQIEASVGRAGRGLSQLVGGAWQGITQSVGQYSNALMGSLGLPPQIGAGIGALAGPLGLVIGLVGALAFGLSKGVAAAEAYGIPFSELHNLNLDKPQAEIEALNDRILALSFDKGLNPEQMVKGIYDVQSTTGQFGTEVENMVARVGVASRALNMDFGTAVSGVSKALVQFKRPLSDVDALIESNAKTVQVGVVTFDELAKVQTEYAGAAASMNQEVDTANKLFAILTTNTKNADVAATMTKGAFQDLGKGSTVDGLKKIGVDVFDANGQMRQADMILRDLVPKLGQMSDQTFSNLKEEIGGSEGLRGLLDYTKASGSEVLRTLNTFDNTKFGLNKSIQESEKRLHVVNQMIGKKMSTAWVQLGQAVMPFWIGVKQVLLGVINKTVEWIHNIGAVVDWFKAIYDGSVLVRAQLNTMVAVFKTAWEMITTAISATFQLLVAPIKAIALTMTGDFAGAWNALKEGGMGVMDTLSEGASNIGNTWKDSLGNIMQNPKAVDIATNPILPAGLELPVTPVLGGLPTGDNPLAPALAGGKGEDPFAKLFKKKEGKADGAVKQGVSEVVGGGAQVRNVTVNIQSLVKELTVRTGSVREGASDIKRHVEEALIRAVQGSELAIAND